MRDIPYRIPLSSRELDDSCAGKSKRLLKIFQEAGYEARYCIFTSRWSDVNLPKELHLLPHEDESTHVYLEVKIGNEWKIVDATWDKSLEGLLPVNDWDGKSDTIPAVPVRECLTLEESAKIMEESQDEKIFADDVEKNGEFYRALNEWLEEYRCQKKKFYAGGFLYNPVTKGILLHRRDSKTPVNPNKWAFFGGLSEGGETPQQTFIREVKEELNIVISQETIRPLCDYLNEELATYRYTFFAESAMEKSNMKLSEGEDFDWIPFEKVFEYDLTEKTRRDLKKFLEMYKL